MGNLSRYKQSFRSFGHVRAAPPAPPPPPPAAPSEPGSLALEDLPAPEEEEDDDDIQSSSTLPSPIREEPPGLVRQIHTGPVTRKESLLNGPKINCFFLGDIAAVATEFFSHSNVNLIISTFTY